MGFPRIRTVPYDLALQTEEEEQADVVAVLGNTSSVYSFIVHGQPA